MKLIANNQQLDIDINQKTELNLQFKDIADMSKQKTNYTKTISLPGTSVNNEFFNDNYDVNIDNQYFKPNKRVECRLTINDLTIIEGSLQLKSIDVHNNSYVYNIIIFGSISNLYTELSGKYLSDLDYSELNHTRTVDAVVNSMDNTVEDGFTYPYALYGNRDDVQDYSLLRDFVPATFLKYIFDKVFAEVGATYDSNFINSDYFKSLIMTHSPYKLTIDESEVEYRSVTTAVTPTTSYSSVGYAPLIGPLINKDINGNYSYQYLNNLLTGYDLHLGNESGTIGSYQLQDNLNQITNVGEFSPVNDGYYNINYNLVVRPMINNTDSGHQYRQKNNGSYYYVRGRLRLDKTDGTVVYLDNTDWIQFDFTDQNYDGFIPLTSKNLNLNVISDNKFLEVGDRIKVEIEYKQDENCKWKFSGNTLYNKTVGVELYIADVLGSDISIFEASPADNSSSGVIDINYNQLIDNILITDFISDIKKMFNLIIVKDENSPNNYIIEPLTDYYKSKQRVKNWDDKLDYSNKYTINPTSKIDFKNYIMKYADDTDFANKEYKKATTKTYGTAVIEIDNDFSNKDYKNELKIIAPTLNMNLFTGDRNAAILCDKRNDTELVQTKVKPRILFKKKENCLSQYKIAINENSLNNPAEYQLLNTYCYAGMYDRAINPVYSLHFDLTEFEYSSVLNNSTTNNLMKWHYEYLKQITDVNSRIFNGIFHLDESDINDFDFRDIIFLKGQYWRVNSIKYIIGQTVHKVELIKIIDIDDYVLRQTVLVGNANCPIDIVQVGNVYQSESGQPITEDCCNSIGGNYVNGQCNVVPIAIDSSSNWKTVPSKSYPESLKRNNNTFAKAGIVTIGKNNTIDKQSNKNLLIVGDNLTVDNNKTDAIITKNLEVTDEIIFSNDVIVDNSISIELDDIIALINNNSLNVGRYYNIITDEYTLYNVLALDTNLLSQSGILKWKTVKLDYYNKFRNAIGSGLAKYYWGVIGYQTINLDQFDSFGDNIEHYFTYQGRLYQYTGTLPNTSFNITALTDIVLVDDDTYYRHIALDIIFDIDLVSNSIIFKKCKYGNNTYTTIYNDYNNTYIYGNNNNGVYNNSILNNNIPTTTPINTCNQAVNNLNIGSVVNNSNSDIIGFNSNIGNIEYNSNDGDIANNSNNGSIEYNSNAGSISNNSNIGDINNNSNNGDIISNSNIGGIISNSNITNIWNNSNIGYINNNSNNYITNNSNIGSIEYNSNTNAIITNNTNMGTIDHNTSSVSYLAGKVNASSDSTINDSIYHSHLVNTHDNSVTATSIGTFNWNMQTNGTMTYTHNLPAGSIIFSVYVIVVNNVGDTIRPLDYLDNGFSNPQQGGVKEINSSIIDMWRKSGGIYDDAAYNNATIRMCITYKPQ